MIEGIARHDRLVVLAGLLIAARARLALPHRHGPRYGRRHGGRRWRHDADAGLEPHPRPAHVGHVGGDDAGDDGAKRGADDPHLRPRGPLQRHRPRLRRDHALRAWLCGGLGGVQRGRDRDAMGAAERGPALADDGGHQHDPRRHPVRCRRRLSVDAAQVCVPQALPLAHGLYHGALAARSPGCLPHGCWATAPSASAAAAS